MKTDSLEKKPPGDAKDHAVMEDHCKDHDHVKPGKAAYYCPMCPGVESEKPGACPKCGMALERNPSAVSTGPKIYTCPMHPQIERDHPGSCPICGMALEPKGLPASDEEDHELNDISRRFWIGMILALPVFILSMGEMIFSQLIPMRYSQWIQFALSTPVVWWAGWPFFVRGWTSIRTWNLNMFTLVALGVGTAWIYSVVAMIAADRFPAAYLDHGVVPVYFEAAAVITVLVLLGQLLEMRARGRTSMALRAILGHAPKTARRIRDGREEEIPISDVHIDDLLRILPGAKVPVDGRITEGLTSINESMITGESIPVDKQVGDKAIGGTINGTGSVIMRAEHVGDDTILSQIVNLVAEAQRSRAPIQQLVDKAAAIFIPSVLAAAAISFAAWAYWGPEPRYLHAMVSAIAVMIIACPCALGLATPISIMVAVGRGAQEGILVKSASALEILGRARTIIVDKTGTLTEGKPKVVSIWVGPGGDVSRALKMAASLEQNSEHPLARSVVLAANERGIQLMPIERFESVPGNGVSGQIEGMTVRIGKETWLAAAGVAIEAQWNTEIGKMREQGQSVILVAVNKGLSALIGVSDSVKNGAKEAIQELNHLGIEIMMITGDNSQTAEQVARHLGIKTVHAGIEPKGKLELVAATKGKGGIVAMAGDGVNDAPALAEADVGIAMGTGTDVAIESAGLILVKGDLQALVRAIHLSRATTRNIRQNLFFAFFYNALGIPVAAGVLYPFFGLLLNPMIAGAAMSLSSVSVITNALRLRKRSI